MIVFITQPMLYTYTNFKIIYENKLHIGFFIFMYSFWQFSAKLTPPQPPPWNKLLGGKILNLQNSKNW